MGMVHTVGLVLHPERDSEVAVETIIGWAGRRGGTVLGLPEEIGRIDCSAVPVGAAALADRADLLVSLGGDGTMLRSMRLAAGAATPVLGVNLGRLGFLTEVGRADLIPALEAVVEGRTRIETRVMLSGQVTRGEVTVADRLALNDVVITRGAWSAMLELDVIADGAPVCQVKADGIIVATATGSTASSPKSSTRKSSGTSTYLGVRPPRSTLSELAINSIPTPSK